ncbi:MAG TPA: hypothetical protein VNT31_00425 [Nocardioides sp.]|nr:hypothetical protein [Nocardioides sp.]
MTIDNLVPDPWPDHVISALEVWRQGHLIRGELGAWLSPGGGTDPVTGDDFTDHTDELVAAAAELSDTGYLAVVSQTCDVVATGPGKRHPFVQVCPVRDVGAAFTAEKVQQIRDGEIVEYIYLTKSPEPGREWAIDLRVSVPLSKGALAATQPIDGFATEEDELALAARVATKYERPALHDYLSKNLVDDLDAFFAKARRTQDWCDDVEQLRLQIEGTRLAPTRVRLIVVTDIEFNGPFNLKKNPLRDRWKAHKKPLREAGIAQAPIAFRHVQKISVHDYRNSIPINLPALGRGTFA